MIMEVTGIGYADYYVDDDGKWMKIDRDGEEYETTADKVLDVAIQEQNKAHSKAVAADDVLSSIIMDRQLADAKVAKVGRAQLECLDRKQGSRHA